MVIWLLSPPGDGQARVAGTTRCYVKTTKKPHTAIVCVLRCTAEATTMRLQEPTCAVLMVPNCSDEQRGKPYHMTPLQGQENCAPCSRLTAAYFA
jgi:hypothetical protein